MQRKAKSFLVLGMVSLLMASVSSIALAQEAPNANSEGKLGPKRAIVRKAENMIREKVWAHQHRGMAHMGGNGLLNLLQMDEQSLRDEMKSGKSLLQIAQDKGISKEQLKDAQLQELTQRLEGQVQEGKMTREQADSMISKMSERLDNMLENERTGGAFMAQRHAPFANRMKDRMQHGMKDRMKAGMKHGLKAGKPLMGERLERQVEEGKITREQLDKLKSNMSERMKKIDVLKEKAIR